LGFNLLIRSKGIHAKSPADRGQGFQAHRIWHGGGSAGTVLVRAVFSHAPALCADRGAEVKFHAKPMKSKRFPAWHG
jgi:hypothetical protein